MTRVTAPSRLHFGLLNVAASDPLQPVAGSLRRAFGGIGLMIDQPGVVVTARPAESWQFEGMLASRAQVFAHRFLSTLDRPQPPLQILVERCPAEHTGLGVGTQLALAVGKAIASETGIPELDSVDLARRMGRGERSAVGVHGFDHGGLIWETGKLPGERLSPLCRCIQLPESWRIAIFMPHVPAGWHGSREQHAFADAAPSQSELLGKLLMEQIVPSAEAGDLASFAEAVHQFNRLAGEPFAATQGGAYSSPEVAELIAALRRRGVAGVGQSSWGPGVFAIVESGEEAAELVKRFGGSARGWVARESIGHRVERA